MARERWLLWLLVAAVLLAGIGYSIHLGDALRYSDETEYVVIARNLKDRGIYSLHKGRPNASRPPGYPFLMAALMRLGAGVVFLRVLNFVALAGCILLTWRIVRTRYGPNAGLVGGALVVSYPVLFYTAGTLYPQTLGSLVLLLGLALVFAEGPASRPRYLLGGLSLGILLLLIPSFVFTVAVVAAWLLFSRKAGAVKGAMVMSVAALVLSGIWSARNYLVLGRFVFGSANSGYMLLLGNSENSTPNGGPNADVSKYIAETVGMNEAEKDAHLRSRAVEYIASHPERVARLFVLKTLHYFNYRNDLATPSEESPARDLVMLVTYGPLLVLFLLRLALWRRYPLSSLEGLIAVVYLANAPYAAIFFPRVRLRLPLDHLAIIPVAGLLGCWIGSRLGRDARPAA